MKSTPCAPNTSPSWTVSKRPVSWSAAGRQQPPVGGIVLLDVATEAEARVIMAGDPYVLHGVADYEPIGWNPTRGRLAPGATS